MRYWYCLKIMLAIAFLGVAVFGQTSRGLVINRQSQTAKLLHQFGKANGDERRARIDDFFIEISNSEKSTGYLFIFCGKVCRYGEVEAHLRGIENVIATSRFPRDRVVILHGGYRESQEVEMWLVPQGAIPPAPVSSINISDVTFKKPSKLVIEYYDCCVLDDRWQYEPIARPKSNGQKSSDH